MTQSKVAIKLFDAGWLRNLLHTALKFPSSTTADAGALWTNLNEIMLDVGVDFHQLTSLKKNPELLLSPFVRNVERAHPDLAEYAEMGFMTAAMILTRGEGGETTKFSDPGKDAQFRGFLNNMKERLREIGAELNISEEVERWIEQWEEGHEKGALAEEMRKHIKKSAKAQSYRVHVSNVFKNKGDVISQSNIESRGRPTFIAQAGSGNNLNHPERGIEETSIFSELKETVKSLEIEEMRKNALLSRIEELKSNKNGEIYVHTYRQFIADMADHMAVLAPFIPALTAFLKV